MSLDEGLEAGGQRGQRQRHQLTQDGHVVVPGHGGGQGQLRQPAHSVSDGEKCCPVFVTGDRRCVTLFSVKSDIIRRNNEN